MTSYCSLTAKVQAPCIFQKYAKQLMLEQEAMSSNMQLWLKILQQPSCCILHYAPELWLIGMFLICTESTDNNLVHRLWLALKFDYHSPEQIGGLLWVSEWSKNANSGEEVAAVSTKIWFQHLSLWVNSFLIRDWEDKNQQTKKNLTNVWTVEVATLWILFWQMGENYADILEQREKI